MPKAVENYARYRGSGEAWLLGRFVVPVSRLDEFEESIARHGFFPPLSALIGGNLDADLERISRGPVPIDTVELKASDAGQIESAMRLIGSRITAYFEIIDVALIPAIRQAGARAKIRTGGTTADAFPEAAQVAQFLKACSGRGTPFKATAGLHHPLRCHRPLTYSADAPSGWMFGFLNLFLAAVLARKGCSPEVLEKLLVEESPAAFSYGAEDVTWAGHRMTSHEIADARREFAISFGSCSFEEPVAELKELQLL
jgi:hypothetical protein